MSDKPVRIKRGSVWKNKKTGVLVTVTSPRVAWIDFVWIDGHKGYEIRNQFLEKFEPENAGANNKGPA